MIRELSAVYWTSEICEALEVSRSGYHAAVQRQKEVPPDVFSGTLRRGC